MSELNKVLNRLERQYKAYEKERNSEGEEGMIDISVACSLADAIPYLIKEIEKQQKELSYMKDGCEYNNEAHKNTLGKVEKYEDVLQRIKVICDKYTEKGWALSPDKIEKIIDEALNE